MVWSKPHHHARGNERKREGQPMPRVDFDQLPDDARLWIFTAERSLSDAEQAQLLREVDRFISQWGAHDVPLTAARELRYDRFLFVAVDQRKAGPSGCSIDALVRQTKALEQEIGIELVNHASGRVSAGIGHRAGATRPVRRARRRGDGRSRDDGL